MTPPPTIADFPQTLYQAPTITIYGPEECPNCDKAASLFTRKNIEFTKINIAEGDENHRFVKDQLGYQVAPVIIVEFERRIIHWGGHRQDMLTGLVNLCTRRVQR